jgi:hypothetical protein
VRKGKKEKLENYLCGMGLTVYLRKKGPALDICGVFLPRILCPNFVVRALQFSFGNYPFSILR